MDSASWVGLVGRGCFSIDLGWGWGGAGIGLLGLGREGDGWEGGE